VTSLLISRLLQSDPSPLGDRLYQPDRDGTKSSLTLSIFSGEDHIAVGLVFECQCASAEMSLPGFAKRKPDRNNEVQLALLSLTKGKTNGKPHLIV